MLKKSAIFGIVIFIVSLFILSKTVLAVTPAPTLPPCSAGAAVGQIRFTVYIDPIVEITNFNSGASGGLKLIAQDLQHNCQVIKPNITIVLSGKSYRTEFSVEIPESNNYIFRLSGPRNLEQKYGKIKITKDNRLICFTPSDSADCGDLINAVPVGTQWDLWTGDANKDGVINLLDFEIYRQNVGLAASVTNNADFNYNGQIDFSESDETGDFRLLTKNFGAKSFEVFSPNPVPTNPPLPRPSPSNSPLPPSGTPIQPPPVPGTCVVHPDVAACHTGPLAESNCTTNCGKNGTGFECVYTTCKTGPQKDIASGYHCCINKPLPNHPSPPPGSCDTLCWSNPTTGQSGCNDKCDYAGYGRNCVPKLASVCGATPAWQCCPNLTPALPSPTVTNRLSPTGPTPTRALPTPPRTPKANCQIHPNVRGCYYSYTNCDFNCKENAGHNCDAVTPSCDTGYDPAFRCCTN